MAEARSGRSATLADVARLAGVSAMTVSRVLNDRGNVSDSTRIRVRRAIDQVRYRPNAMARSLVLGRSQTIGVVTFDTAQYGPGSAVLGIERAARERGYGVTITVMERPDHDALRSAVLSLNDRMVDGMVVIAPFTAMAGALRDLGRGTPVVAAEAGHQGEVPIVGIDQGLGARLATRHLLEFGHRTVHHIAGPADWIESRLRSNGWRAELSEHGVTAPPVLDGDWTAKSGYDAGLRLADDGSVTAVFVANDQMALGLLHALHERGVRVPQDVSVVGFDDTPESAFFLPSLTTVRQDFATLGEVAVELLDRLVTDAAYVAEDRLLIDPTLVVRKSAGPPAT
ncbi:unannotated protein [freshwater metagenome]|uniref:Unannotated protein n=1 Tax=freshwater metagenome TaxID=449393 RepID=A0A6J6T868_9ZZZZ|nr:LacI family DNA-binding transcriptional regulator [Actinomycetota bacterium]